MPGAPGGVAPPRRGALANRVPLLAGGKEGAVLKMGFLHREIVGRWGARRVWVVLDQGVLFTFKRPPEFSPTAVLPLDGSVQTSIGPVEADGAAPFVRDGLVLQRFTGKQSLVIAAALVRGRIDAREALHAGFVDSGCMCANELSSVFTPGPVRRPSERQGATNRAALPAP